MEYFLNRYLQTVDTYKYLHITNSLSHHIGRAIQVNKILSPTGGKTKEAWSARLYRCESSDLATDSKHKTASKEDVLDMKIARCFGPVS